jgi:hypothetical protein
VCVLYNKADVKDEYNVLIMCPLYTNLESDTYILLEQSMFKCCELHKLCKENGACTLGKFVYEAFTLRDKTAMYTSD